MALRELGLKPSALCSDRSAHSAVFRGAELNG
ncbi:paREP2b [Pyrobaculum aerophilum str. IM2]|uniref:PaREP2b n=1 Tax=Pyrobaculum aerophilum (strain ATCC 51768 / DSM 7523 / JCM 9630 / CIP 104966 / NBRC 100827 / IM2) TaxID=178306 RepID=Q8ZTV8_PYRAE|nr:paREP2b [Pyrobaculum aerophilum str. IM2]